MTRSNWEENKGIGSTGKRTAAKQAIAAARLRSFWERLVVVGLALAVVGSARAQEQAPDQTLAVNSQAPASASSPSESTNKTAGDYTVQQSVEFGYRDSLINGNLNNYDTFENLTSGVRLFDYSVEMHSIDHKGPFFDNLSFVNSGYGGDPNDISRLHIDKSNLYDFRVMFRQDKDYWNYNLLANPLNPTTGPIPNGESIVNSPHALDLTRKMQDYDLTLFPQSRLRFRVGYSRNADTGPASTPLEGGTEPLLSETVNEVTNSYRMGVDYRGLPKTTLSFDELLTYTAINNSVADNDFWLSADQRHSRGFGHRLGWHHTLHGRFDHPAGGQPHVQCIFVGEPDPEPALVVSRRAFQLSIVLCQEFRDQRLGQLQRKQEHSLGLSPENIDGWASRTLARGSTTGGPDMGRSRFHQRQLVRRLQRDQQIGPGRPIFLRRFQNPVGHVGHGGNQCVRRAESGGPHRHVAPALLPDPGQHGQFRHALSHPILRGSIARSTARVPAPM